MLDTRDIAETVSRMPVQERAVLLWVLDIFAEVVRAGETTLMTSKAAGILLGPNLFRMDAGADSGVQLLQIKVRT